MLTGLDWSGMAAKLEGADAETRARVLDLLRGIEAGAMKMAARTAREPGNG